MEIFMHYMGLVRKILLLFGLIAVLGKSGDFNDVSAAENTGRSEIEKIQINISSIWGPTVQQWSGFIGEEARANGLDPDLIAAVVNSESNGVETAVSHAGAVGLMGVMPAGPGLEWRPSSEALENPALNVNWGVAILAEIIRQSGGDIAAALAAYSGGWDQTNNSVPQDYARGVLDNYGRAVAARSGVSPEIASRWTVATEISRGNVPIENLILNDVPVSGLRKYGEHVVYQGIDDDGTSFYIKGYAVPLAVVVPLETTEDNMENRTVDRQLLARLGMADPKVNKTIPRFIIACLPGIDRLRGQMATRWFAPSSCPYRHR